VATNLAIDDSLLEEAVRVSGLKTKRETVNTALKEFIQKRKQAEIAELFGIVEYDQDYDYKSLRTRK
jgi:Arc/MetJ family transcription regulator